MNHEEFTLIFEEQVNKCRETLITKAGEYADDDDRLHNFRVAAELVGTDLRSALGGMMVKHIVSIYDMIEDERCAPIEKWEEKVGDALNYLFLLMAVVKEELDTPSQEALDRFYRHFYNKET
jgi:hypothetical protein